MPSVATPEPILSRVVTEPAGSVVQLGAIAAQALTRSDGLVHRIDAFPEAPYRIAANEVIWIGVAPRVMHPRMVVLRQSLALEKSARLDGYDHARVWRPAGGHIPLVDRSRFIAASTQLALAIRAQQVLGTPTGFGAALIGAPLAFPLTMAVARFARLVAAVQAHDDAANLAPATAWVELEAAAVSLLGLGAGFTPSGDDLVGGLLFAAQLVAPDPAPWRDLGNRLVTAAGTRTHLVSAALLSDLVYGASYSVVHDLIAALRVPTSAAVHPDTVTAGRALVGTGHSSGWDMLTGLLLGANRRVHS